MIYDKEKRIIIASEGMVLTDGKAFSSPGGMVYLGVSCKPDDWQEITEDDYNCIMKKLEEGEEGYE